MEVVVSFKPDERARELAERVARGLEGAGVKVRWFPEADPCAADGLVVVGGDGTLLYTLSKAPCETPPVMTVRAGRRAFLLDVEPREVEEAVRKFVRGEYQLEEHKRLEVDGHFALNEFAVLSKWRRVTKLNVEVSGYSVYEGLEGDGIIVSTTLGSSAYALSAGGPIVDPRAEVLLLVPVNPIQLDARAVVLPKDSEIKVKIVYNTKEVVTLLDGIVELTGEEFVISLTGPKVRFARFRRENFYRRLIELRSFKA
ncbi:NAD(+)/NADH kinase [Ignicoccus hospitalis]|uniref:NAD kinase n=1 Tax=Ignicoccus hospitalis (strain KIN4/I / DSM 18386 / JCM 14125) TaxID=453591 RepID=A8A9W6_IGNH4|nr:NAD(+)/NADH kinase [Ignicoccus hospitalis]ABU81718.1 NAD(+) kinase [Ignicoccus hospitalis KIN4/I]HIH89982.1 NAD(+)/NADH kinase [Desulfurococcaceae archaeon]